MSDFITQEFEKAIRDVEHQNADLRAKLERAERERDEYKRKYTLVCDSAEYRECCDLRVRAENERDAALVRVKELEEQEAWESWSRGYP